MKRKSFIMLLVLMIICNISLVVTAATVTAKPAVDPENEEHLFAHVEDGHPDGQWHNYIARWMQMDGANGYCIGLHYGIDLNDTEYTTSTDWSGYIEWLKGEYGYDQKECENIVDYIQKVAYYGATYPGHTEEREWFMAAQELIWERQSGVEVIWTDTVVKKDNPDWTGVTIFDIESYKKEIEKLVANAGSKPSFDGLTYTKNLGEKLVLNDVQKQLPNFSIVEANNLKAKIKDNELIIELGNEPGEYRVLMEQKGVYTNYSLVSLGSVPTKQPVLVPGNIRVSSLVKVKVQAGKITIIKEDSVTGSKAQGDATLKGAEYVVKNADGQVVSTLKTSGDNASATTDWLPLGTYTVVEQKESNGYTLSDKEYTVTLSIENPNTTLTVNEDQVVTENVILGRVKIKKMDQNPDTTHESPAKGARVKMTLISAIGKKNEEDCTYYATVDANGEAEFIDEKNIASAPYTIPYGKYRIEEVKASDAGEHLNYFFEPLEVDVKGDHQYIYRIVSDEPVPFYPVIRKVDKDTREVVKMAGFKYKIWQLANEELGIKAGWVSQFDPSSNSIIDEFATDKTGTVVLPDKLRAAEYVFYEVDCPKGYYIPEKYRLPANEADYGNYEVSGVYVDVTKSVLYVPEDQIANLEDIYLDIPMEDPQLKAKISLYKTGEVLSDVTIKNEAITGEEIYSAKYETKPLKNIAFEVFANEDIYSPDKRELMYSKGEYVERITTEEDGYANSSSLPLGEYRLVEAPRKGYKPCEDIIVRLENEDKYKEVQIKPVTVENVRQKLFVKVKKIFQDSRYGDIDVSKKNAIFTVRTKEPIKNYQGNVVIPANALVSVIEFKDNNQISEDIDLPEGKYELEEIYASEPYQRITDKKTVVLEGDSTGKTEIKFEEEVKNTTVRTELCFIKFSASSFADADATGLVGEKVSKDLVDSEIAKFIDWAKGKTREEVLKEIKDKAWITKSGAKYAIYKDEACTEPLIDSETKKEVVFQTDENGIYILSDIPLGVYYVKEIEAPVYTDGEMEIPYQITEEPIMIDLREEKNTSTSSMIFRGLWDESVVYPAIEKTDVFTGDAVPNCTFEVLDSNKNVIYHATTNEKGVAGIPIDRIEKGKKYIFREIAAPSVYNEDGVLYELNKEDHEFIADYEVVDGKIEFKNKIHIENYRPTTDITFKKVDSESGELIPNCKFELRSKENEDYVITGVTDEKGEYVFENVPYGEYTYTELEAPEEYMIDTTPHDVTVNGKTMDIIVPNTLKPSPDTGDINVVILSLMAVASMLVISYIIVKNKKVRE